MGNLGRGLEVLLACVKVTEAVATLPPMLRVVVTTVMDCDMNVMEASKKLGLPYTTTSERFARGLKRMRNTLLNDPIISDYWAD